MNWYKITHRTLTGRITVERETSLKYVNQIVAAVMKENGQIIDITKYTR